MTLLVLVVSAVLGLLRLFGEKGEFFQAVAHLWVAWLFCKWWFTNDRKTLCAGIVLTILEVACFLGLHIPLP